MAETINILDNEDLPCNDWNDDFKDNCPMKEKWLEGEEVICYKCGWIIGYNSE